MAVAHFFRQTGLINIISGIADALRRFLCRQLHEETDTDRSPGGRQDGVLQGANGLEGSLPGVSGTSAPRLPQGIAPVSSPGEEKGGMAVEVAPARAKPLPAPSADAR